MIPDAYEALIGEGAAVELGEGVAENDLAGLFYNGRHHG